MADQFRVRTIRDYSEIEEIREIWSAWHQHPNSDIDFYLTVMQSMPGILRPHTLLLYRDRVPRALLIGRLEHAQIQLRIGYRNLVKIRVRQITFIYKGYLGENSPENTELFIKEI